MIKDIEYILKKFFLSESYLLKKRLIRANKNNYEKELSILSRFSNPNMDAVDVGVYRGVYSYRLSQEFKHVHAFEANPLIYPFLKKNLPEIITNISLYNCALSDQVGFTNLKMPIRNKSFFKNNYEELYQLGAATIHLNNNFDNFNTIEVEKKKMDDILYDKKIGFIKIDVEGHEKEVINGSINIIKKYKPNLLVEIEERHNKNKVMDTINYINKLGYSSFFLDEDKLVETKNLKEFKNINNFIFKSQ